MRLGGLQSHCSGYDISFIYDTPYSRSGASSIGSGAKEANQAAFDSLFYDHESWMNSDVCQPLKRRLYTRPGLQGVKFNSAALIGRLSARGGTYLVKLGSKFGVLDLLQIVGLLQHNPVKQFAMKGFLGTNSLYEIAGNSVENSLRSSYIFYCLFGVN